MGVEIRTQDHNTLMSLIRSTPGRFVLEKSATLIGRNPEKNFVRLLDLSLHFARLESHRQNILQLKEALLSKPYVVAFVKRVFTEIHPRLLRGVVFNWFVNWILFGQPIIIRKSQELGVHIPYFFLVDPTSKCNLRCIGCWAGEYPKTDVIGFERLDRLLEEARELGIYWVVMSGGEPFLYPHLFDLAEKHRDTCFMLYTNGTLIDEKMADKIFKVANMTPAISLEGWEETTDRRRGKGVFARVMRAMDLLKERGIPFGFSLTITRENCYEVMSEEFIDFLINKGCLYGWTFHYVPVGRDPNFDLMITPEQRSWLARQVPKLRSTKPIQFADFWNDGELAGGCIAGGRRYFHITARGDVEPCAFVHFACDNIKEKSLIEVLKNPLFKAYQSRQPFSDNLLRPCPIIDVPGALREIVRESGARPTHEGADDIFKPENAHVLDEKARLWKEKADEIWYSTHQRPPSA